MSSTLASTASAAIAALSAFLVAIYSARRARENQRAIEELKADLEDRKSSRVARREYEFHARQRLYEEYEPLRFQLLEAVDTAKCQIEVMSEQALDRRRDYLGATPTGNYWLLGTIYHLLHPAALFRVMQRRLTLVDLRIEPKIHTEFLLAKKAYLALSHDARIAEMSDLPYTPYVDGWRERRLVDPAQFRRQGLPLGRLDNAVDTLILRADASSERIATFGEFEIQFNATPPNDVSGPIGAARDLFDGFNPGGRPVLWRILLSQFRYLQSASGVHYQRRRSDPWALTTEQEKSALGFLSPISTTLTQVAEYLRAYVVADLATGQQAHGLTIQWSRHAAVPNAGASRLGSADATASRRLQLAPSGYTLGRGSRRAASLGPHVGRVRLIETTLGRREARPPEVSARRRSAVRGAAYSSECATETRLQ